MEMDRLSKQHRRLQAIRGTARLLGIARDAPQARPPAWTTIAMAEVKNNIAKFITNANKAISAEAKAVDFLLADKVNWH